MNLILGAGLSGLSCSYHLGHENCLVLEKRGHAFGHVHSEWREGFTWDEGPHVSFTKQEYVRTLFSESVGGEFAEYEVRATNYFRGNWIDHPAQSNLYQIPDPLRSECIASLIASAENPSEKKPCDYGEWLEQAFGSVFAETFAAAYTRKYWTCDPDMLGVDWIGCRVFRPDIEQIKACAAGPLPKPTHYITTVRYPKRGGFEAFARKLREGANIAFGADVIRIDLKAKRLWTADGREFSWTHLINTLPLPVFMAVCVGLPANAYEAARQLLCSQLLLVNIAADHPTVRSENWIYVYDEDMLSTRINCTEKLSPSNAPAGCTGVQVEVYGSRLKPFRSHPAALAEQVEEEVRVMGLVEKHSGTRVHTVFQPWANVVFTSETAELLNVVWSALEPYGLNREADDLHPLTDWASTASGVAENGALSMAGRFGQWKYFWTDDCVLRGLQLGRRAS